MAIYLIQGCHSYVMHLGTSIDRVRWNAKSNTHGFSEETRNFMAAFKTMLTFFSKHKVKVKFTQRSHSTATPLPLLVNCSESLAHYLPPSLILALYHFATFHFHS